MAESFSCSLNVLYGGLGIGKLQFLIRKGEKKFQLCFFPIFGHKSPGSGSGTESGSGIGSGSAALEEPDSLFLQRGEGEADRREGGPAALPR